jgi:hypothetical protein
MVASGAAFVYLYGPGKMPTQYFMCLGISPKQDPETNVKVCNSILEIRNVHKYKFAYSFQSQDSFLAFQYFYTLH